MGFYSQDGELKARSYPRTFGQEVEVALSALDCLLNGEKAIYVSSDLTTGKRFFRLLREYGARDSSDLKLKLGEERYRLLLWDPNTAAANDFARRIREQFGGNKLVITPAPFVAPSWSQAEYLVFWETCIRTRVEAVFFNDSWQYSNGCTYEFAVAQSECVRTFDSDGMPLHLEEGIMLIAEAVRDLEAEGIQPIELRTNLTRLRKLRQPPRHHEGPRRPFQ